uniref:Inter-alpha-trypsin inhibitor heavy chain family member 6 n=1 Tax=Denticeps clupeoides TaxID=299321 RepID=A0AAY4C1I8_9TELE
ITRILKKKIKKVIVTDYHVQCMVVSRYAHTTVQSSVWNQLPITKEAAFEVDLPSSAFISNFSIISNGKDYVAHVKERMAARKIYDAAKKQGKTAGLVATKEREIEKFRVAVSVPPGSHVSFSLTYEELLSRKLGRYELTLGLQPGQPVQNLSVDVRITEQSGLRFVKALPLRTRDEVPPSTQIKQSSHCAHVHYNPSLQQQKSLSPKGLNADFIVQYDVEVRDLIGDIQTHDGYFVHYFAPRDLPVIPKDIIFVLDISGSMIGTKMKQTKQAMSTILGDLREGDFFNIITFSHRVQIWKKGRTVQASRQNIRDAKEFIRKISADGWTDINAALLAAAQFVNVRPSSSRSTRSPHRVPLIIFLTDGEATIGVTAGETILRNAQEALGSASLFGLAFGDDADYPLLRRLALENRGVSRMVYEDADAALQFKGFYDEVASPLLSDIQLSYLGQQAFEITRSFFPNYFQGSELVVVGQLKPAAKQLKVALTANDSKQKCAGVMEGAGSFVHRLWAYFTIKELLLAKLNSSDPLIQRLLVEKATNLSLRYNFVTPVTSLVVVKPDVDDTPKPTSPGGHSFIHCSVPVDGDPHFVIRLPKKDQRLCFTVDGEANDVLRLVEDTERGITVDGHLMLAPSKQDMPDRTRTYFDQITITVARNGAVGVTITLTLDSVVIDGEETVALSTSHSAAVTKPGVQVVINSHQGCWIRLKKDVIFLVLFHRYDHQSYLQMAHLGFYIAEGKGLSPHSQGLLGQFQHANLEVVQLQDPHAANFHHGQLRPGASLALGVLKHKDVLIPVSLQEKHLKDTLGKKHMDQCWVVPKVEVEKLLGLSYLSYVVDHI